MKFPNFDRKQHIKSNLHSSMDRFEVRICSLYMQLLVIYIPVWIDLKLGAGFSIRDICDYLHSSMDRFEVGN